MARLKTNKLTIKEGDVVIGTYSYDVNVVQDGTFTTTLPKDLVAEMEKRGASLHQNQLGNKGYFQAERLDELEKKIRAACDEAFSMTLKSETIVLRYVIETVCAYMKTVDGDLVPNGSYPVIGGRDCTWLGGTKEVHAQNGDAYGIRFYCKPFWKKVYAFKSGREMTDFREVRDIHASEEDHTNLRYLANIVSVKPPSNTWGTATSPIQEVEYTEEIASVFVDIYKAIFKINEKIKEFISPDMIKQIAASKQRLIG